MAKLQTKSVQADNASQKIFMSTMLGMSWQMAIAVLVPTIGGYKLDEHFGTTPYVTIVGLLVALAAMVAIVVRAIKNLNSYMLTMSSDVASSEASANSHQAPTRLQKTITRKTPKESHIS
jgi:F0F1-type ATP synthase assembly protein I